MRAKYKLGTVVEVKSSTGDIGFYKINSITISGSGVAYNTESVFLFNEGDVITAYRRITRRGTKNAGSSLKTGKTSGKRGSKTSRYLSGETIQPTEGTQV
jgi:hypothetical protein